LAAPNLLKSSKLARFLSSEKKNLLWDILGFSRFSAIKNLHPAKLMICNCH